MALVISDEEIEQGRHLWAKMYDGNLAVLFKDSNSDYYICEGWEGQIR